MQTLPELATKKLHEARVQAETEFAAAKRAVENVSETENRHAALAGRWRGLAISRPPAHAADALADLKAAAQHLSRGTYSDLLRVVIS